MVQQSKESAIAGLAAKECNGKSEGSGDEQ